MLKLTFLSIAVSDNYRFCVQKKLIEIGDKLADSVDAAIRAVA